MERQESDSADSRLRGLYGLPYGLFQTSRERTRLRAAVYQVFGSQPWGGCCSNKLLEALLEAGERCYVKQQLYWDFQLLDSDHDGYLSAQDAELLLAQVPRATGEACHDFLRSRRPGVAWSDIEDWLFHAPQVPVDGARPHTRRPYCSEQGPRARVSAPQSQFGVKRGDEQLPEGWDPRNLATLHEEKPSGVVAALERKYQVLQRKLCAEMLQAHYGQSLWASLPHNVKEEKISELETLVDFGLREGSILSLSSLPGAQHSVRSGAPDTWSDLTMGPLDPSVTEGTAAHALQQLQHRKQAEVASLVTQRHLLVGSNPEISHRLLHLHAQTELVEQEASFYAALLVLELFTGERFWELGPVEPEACHQELARLRLAAGHGSEPVRRESKTMPGGSMRQVLLDKLLLQQERDRTSLVQILLTLRKQKGIYEQGYGREQPIHLEAGTAESSVVDMSPPLEEAISKVLELAQKQLRVARRAEVSWQDCAIPVLVSLQREQQEELSRALEDLAGISSGREGETYERLLSRLQEPPLMGLAQHLHPLSQQQQPMQETLQKDQIVRPIHMAPPDDPQATTAKEILWREETLGSIRKRKKGEDKGLIRMTSEDLSAQGELEPKWEGPEPQPPRVPEKPDPQEIIHRDVDVFKVQGTMQTGADKPQTQKQQDQKSLQPQEFPEPHEVPEEFQQDPQGMRDPQKILEIPQRQEDSQNQTGSLVPHHSQKQGETETKFFQGQGGIVTESEIFHFQGEEPLVPCGIPGSSEDPNAVRDGEFGGLQDSSQKQEPSQGPVVMWQAISESQGLFLRKSKSLVSLKSATTQALLPQGFRVPEIPLHTGLQVPHLLAAQHKEMGVLDTQAHSEPQRETEIVQVDETREGMDMEPQSSSKGKQESRIIQKKVDTEVFVPQDEGSYKLLHTEDTKAPLSEKWRDSEVDAKTPKAFKDLHEESLTLQVPGTSYSKDPCHEEENIPETSQLQGALLKKSKSLDPQELSRTGIYGNGGSPEIQQEHKYPQASHPQKRKGAKAQKISQKVTKDPNGHILKEGLQYQTFPDSKQESVPTPEPLQQELETSTVKEKLQAVEVSSKETQVPSPEAQKTEVYQDAMEADPLHAQEELQRNLVRTQVVQSHHWEEMEVLLSHVGLARKAKSLDSGDMARTQKERQLGKLPIPGMEERRESLDHLQKETGMPQAEQKLMEKLEGPELPQGYLHPRISRREPEVSETLQAQKKVGPEAFQGSGSEFLQRNQGGLVFQGGPQDHCHPEEESPKTAQGQKGTELSQPQNLPFCGILWRKSKSLELRKPPSFHLEELREPEGPSVQSHHPQTDREALVSQESKQSEDLLSQSQQRKSQILQLEEPPPKEEEALQVRQMAPNGAKFSGSKNIEEMKGFSSEEERRKTQIPPMQETQLEKSTSPISRDPPPALQSHEKRGLEFLYDPQTTPQKHAGIPQIFRDPETPPLLWKVLGQKAKSFELGEPRVHPSPELELTLAQKMPQKEVCVAHLPQEEVKGVFMVHPQVKPETQKSEEIREPKILYPQGLKDPVVPQMQAEEALPVERDYQDLETSRISPEPLVKQSDVVIPGMMEALQPQDMKELGAISVQKVPQRRPQMLHGEESPQTEVELPRHFGTIRETRELHLSERKSLENVDDPQENVPPKTGVPPPREPRTPESPPLLWGALGLKSKSFELRKPQALEAQGLRESLIVQSQGRSQVELEAPKTQERQDSIIISVQELEETEVTQFQARKETERLKSPLLQEKGLLGELKMDLETPQAQGPSWIKSKASETQQRAPELLKGPEAIGQELVVPQSLQLYGNKCLEMSQAQGNGSPSQMVLPHKEYRGPDTSPPLLWTTLGMKAKSFELRKPRIFQTQDLRDLEPTLFPKKISQEESQASEIQELQKLQRTVPQREPHRDAESHKIQASEDPGILYPLEQQTPQVQASHFEGTSVPDPQIFQPPGTQEKMATQASHIQHGLLDVSEVERGLHPQEPRGLEPPNIQLDPQRSQATSQSHSVPQQGLKEPQALQSQPAPERERGFLQHQTRISPETPPLLWWALELTQQRMQHMEMLVSPQPQEVIEPPARKLQEKQEEESKCQKPKEFMDQKNLYSQELEAPAVEKDTFQNEGVISTVALLQPQERRDTKCPQAQDIPSEVDSICSRMELQQMESQVPERAELTQSPRKSPQAFQVQALKKMEYASFESPPQIERDTKKMQGSSEEQKTFGPEEIKELKAYQLQGSKPQMCYSYKAGETEGLLPSGGLARKSKSLDSMKLRAPKTQELCEMESPQVQEEPEHSTKYFPMAPEDLQMKPQKRKGPPSFKSEGKSGPEGAQAQSTQCLLQPQDLGTESHTAPSPPSPLQSLLELKSELFQVMEPRTYQSEEQQEGIVLQPQGPLQMDPEDLKPQESMDPKTSCSQGHCEGGRCEFRTEEYNHIGTQGTLQRHLQTFLLRESSWPPAALLKKSKSLDLQELSVPGASLPQKLKKPEISQPPECLQGCTETSEAQVLESGEKCPSHQEAENGEEFPAQKEPSFQKTSTSEKRLAENGLGTLDSQGDMHSEVEQLQGWKETDVLKPLGTPQVGDVPLQATNGMQNSSESFVSLEFTDSRHLCPQQVGGTPLRVLETPELTKSPTQVPSASMETKTFLPSWILRKSKSLDLRELQALKPLALVGEMDSPNLQSPSRVRISQPQKPLQEELSELQKIKGPVVLNSETFPVQEPPQKDQVGPLLQEERMCGAEKAEQVGLKSAQNQEQMGNNGEVLCSQALADTQMFCSTECGDVKVQTLQECPLNAKQPLQMQRGVQTEPELHGLMEPQLLLDPQEERGLQGSPILSNLLRKSKTLGLELLRRSDVSQIQHLPRPESPQSQATPEPGTQLLLLQRPVEQDSYSIEGISKMDTCQLQEIQNIVEGTLESPENLESKGVAHKMEVEPMKAKTFLHMNQDFIQEQGRLPAVAPQSSLAQTLPPHEVPQFGIELLQELGRLHNELESLRPQEVKDGEKLHPHKTQNLFEPEGHGAAKLLGTVGLQILQHQELGATESHQPLTIDQTVSEVHGTHLGRQETLPPPQEAQEFCQTLGTLKKEHGTDLPTLMAPEMGLPKTYPVFSDMMMSPCVLQSQEHIETKSHCLQETPQVGWESLEDAGKELERGTEPQKSQNELIGALQVEPQILERQDLSRMNQDIRYKVLSGVEDLHSQDRELGLQQIISSQEPLHRQPQTLETQDQEIRDSVIFLPLSQREPKAQQVDEHFQGEQETSPFPKSRCINLFQLQKEQEVQTEMGTFELRQLEEALASQEQKEGGIWSVKETPWSALSTPGFCPLDQNNLHPGASKSRLEISVSWGQKEEVLQTWENTVVTMLSPASPGKCDEEELRWDPAASLSEGLSRETSGSVAQDETLARPPGPQQPVKEEAQGDGKGITEPITLDSEEARTWEPPPPRPPCREKAFIWFSHEEKKEALQRLAATQARGERRRQQDKERQILRFQERLLIAKHRKSEEDLLGSSPTEQWPLSAAHLCQQDQAGQKTAVKRHLEKVKRERTYVMQSKRERNTLRFKELLNPLMTHGEESPEPRQLGDA